MRLKYFYSFLVLASLFACTRDDICTEETPKTSLLIIRFYDYEAPQFLKPVDEMAIYADTISTPLFEIGTTDSIAIPLKTDIDITDYSFIKNANDTLFIGDQEILLDETLRFSYTRQSEYINRACAFRVDYYNLEEELLTENPLSQWIDSIHIRIDSLTPQSQHEPHIRIYH